MQNYQATIISQYANSPTLTRIIENYNDYLDIDADSNNLLKNLLNIQTATTQGLDIWGRIVGVSRSIVVPALNAYLGFSNGTQPFGQAVFYNGVIGTSQRLDDDTYRRLIIIKALANITRCTLPNINQILRLLYPDIPCYVVEAGNMHMRFIFTQALDPTEYAILTQSGVAPRPAGVKLDIVYIDPSQTFGFNEAGEFEPFNQAVFYS